MPGWKNGISVAMLLGFVALAGYHLLYRQSYPSPPAKIENRIPALTKLVADQEQKSAQAVAKYKPKCETKIDDLDAPAGDMLRQLPGVVDVQVGVSADKPTHRIVHLRDWHFVPKDLYAIDLKAAHGRQLSDEEIDQLHRELLLECEIVQLEQMALLRCLIKYHGLKRIYCEGLTPSDLPDYNMRIDVLRKMVKEQVPQLEKQLADVRDLLKGMKPESERYQNAKKIEAEITGMLDQHKAQLLEVGAPGRLLVAGEIEEVLPLDDTVTLDQAKPITPDGKMKLDPMKLTARHDAQVKAVLEKSGFGLIVLGGSHDVSDSVRRLGAGKCEYLRITTKRFKEFSE